MGRVGFLASKKVPELLRLRTLYDGLRAGNLRGSGKAIKPVQSKRLAKKYPQTKQRHCSRHIDRVYNRYMMESPT